MNKCYKNGTCDFRTSIRNKNSTEGIFFMVYYCTADDYPCEKPFCSVCEKDKYDHSECDNFDCEDLGGLVPCNHKCNIVSTAKNTLIRCYRQKCKFNNNKKANCGYCKKKCVYITNKGCMDYIHIDDVEKVSNEIQN